VDIPQMNISQIDDRLRAVLLRRIERGELTVGLLARQTHLEKSHISKYLHANGGLSKQSTVRILAAQDLSAEYLIELGPRVQSRVERTQIVPVVSHTSALFDPEIRASAVGMWLHLAVESLEPLEDRKLRSRTSWRRFVAMRVDDENARAMEPLVYEGAIAVIDRHYNSLDAWHPPRQNLYAVREGRRVVLRYIDPIGSQLIIRALNIGISANLIEMGANTNPGEYIAGRVAMTLNPT
jgi:plasmid maintenance system antidote protein VapI